MSIATEITRLNNAKAAIKSAIENKGVTVPSSTKIDGYASLVSSIPGIVPTGTINITENGDNIDVKQYAKANVKIPTVTTIEPMLLTLKNYDEYTLPHTSSVPITLNEGDYVLDGDIITYTVDIDFDGPVIANETLAIIAKQVKNILPITIQRKGQDATKKLFTLTVSYDVTVSSYIDLYYYVISNNYKLCTIGIP